MNEDLIVLPKEDPQSPFNSRIPDNRNQTETLSKRFELWRSIIKSLITYFKAIIISNQQASVVNTNVANSFDFPFFTNINTNNVGSNGDARTLDLIDPEDAKKQSFFTKFGEGSIQDVQILLKKYHLNLAIHQKEISSNLTNEIIPKLEELQKDLVFKIKEIKSLSDDFKENSLKEEIALSGQLLDDYIKSMEKLTKTGDCSIDPYLLRIKLEIQLKQQLHIENYLEEAFMNLQMTALMLEKIIFKEIQSSLNKYSELISQEIFIHYNDLINELHQGVISKKSYFEWDNFITKDNGKIFLKIKHDDILPEPKKLSNLKYPFNNSIISKTIRSGELYKKSKFLKTYSKSFYILTMNYLHEFKSSKFEQDLTPINSIKLNDCLLVDYNETKFQLKVKTEFKSVNYIFKNHELTNSSFEKWIKDLKALTSFNSFNERFDYISMKVNNNSQIFGINNNSTNQLQPMSSNYSMRSVNIYTPKIEVSNPIDISTINTKLQNLQMNPIKDKEDYIPPIKSELTVPTVQIQEPTPTRTTAPMLPDPIRSATPMIGGDSSDNDNESNQIQLTGSLYDENHQQVDLTKLLQMK